MLRSGSLEKAPLGPEGNSTCRVVLDKPPPSFGNRALECGSGGTLKPDLPGSGTLRELPAEEQPGSCSSQPQPSYHANLLTELMLTANILLHTLAEKCKRKLAESKYSHTPDKLFCAPPVHSQPPACFHILLKSYSTMQLQKET